MTFKLFRPTKASFTSLSSKLGEVISELHLKLASLLLSATIGNASPNFTLALLGVARNLGRNSPYSRLTRALADPLVRAILPCLRNTSKFKSYCYFRKPRGLIDYCTKDDLIAIVATASLTEIASNVYGNPAPKQLLDLKAVGAVCDNLLHKSESTLLKQEIWGLLACVVSNDADFDMCVHVIYREIFSQTHGPPARTPSLTILQLEAPTSDTTMKESQIPYLAALLRQDSLVDLRQYSESLLGILRTALTSPRGELRVLACGLISHIRIDEVTNGCELDLVEEGLRLTEDEDGPVRAAACRALGLLVKSPSFDSVGNSNSC